MARAEFSSNVTVASEYTTLGTNSVYGVVAVGTAVVEMKVGANAVAERTTLFIQAADGNADAIYLGLDNTVTSTHYAIKLTAGQSTQITLSKGENVLVYGISGTLDQKVSIIEGVA